MVDWKTCAECGQKMLIWYGDVCDICLDERWPDALDWADADYFENWLFCIDDVDPGDTDVVENW